MLDMLREFHVDDLRDMLDMLREFHVDDLRLNLKRLILSNVKDNKYLRR